MIFSKLFLARSNCKKSVFLVKVMKLSSNNTVKINFIHLKCHETENKSKFIH